MLNWIVENLEYIVIGIVLICAVIICIKQPKKIKEWLLAIVTHMEAEYGSGTGALKLAEAYATFVERFPILSIFISKDMFSKWVDEVLITMREWLETNNAIKSIVKGE